MHRRQELGLPAGTRYFNAGVLLMNLRKWRDEEIADRVLSFIRLHRARIVFEDQDALNAVLSGEWLELSACWNAQHPFFHPRLKRELLLEEIKDPAVVHFSAGRKPWHWALEHPFKQDYRRYRQQTPWPMHRLEGTLGWFGRLRRGIRAGTSWLT